MKIQNKTKTVELFFKKQWRTLTGEHKRNNGPN